MAVKDVISSLGDIVSRRKKITEKEELEKKSQQERRLDERRKEPRFKVVSHAHEFVYLTIGKSKKKFPVVDLSTRGLSFAACLDSPDEIINKELQATIHLGETDQIHLKIMVVNYREEHFGCKIIKTPDSWDSEISAYLDPLRIAEDLSEIDPKYVKQDMPGFTIRWFHAPPICDVYIWEADKKIEQVQVFYLHNIIEWNSEKGPRTGYMDAHETEGRRTYAKTDMFHYHEAPDSELIQFTFRMLKTSKVPSQVALYFCVQKDNDCT